MILPLVFYILIFFATFTVVCTRIFLSCNCASDFLEVYLLNCPDLDSTCYCWFILVLSVFKTLAVLSKYKVINLANSGLQAIWMIMISFGLTKLY